MNKNPTETLDFLTKLNIFLNSKKNKTKNRIVIAPTFLSIQCAINFLNKSNIEIFAQNAHFESCGAYTGEISCKMLKDVGVKGLILGHSERRNMGETDFLINEKIKSALNNNLEVTVCVGESSEEFKKRESKKVVISQVLNCLKNIKNMDYKKIIIAYEPIWSIGSKKSADPNLILQIINLIKEKTKEIFQNELKVIYGGSVTLDNINEILNIQNINGVLIGSASLDVENLIKMISNFF